MPHAPAPTRLFDRAIVRLTPESEEEDVKGFLQGLVTNDLNQPLPIYAGLLSAQGKALFDFLVWPSGDRELLIDCEADLAEELVKRLSLYRLRRKIEEDSRQPHFIQTVRGGGYRFAADVSRVAPA